MTDAVDTALDRCLAALRDALYADAALYGWPAYSRFDALPAEGAYVALLAEPEESSATIGEDGRLLCVPASVAVRLVCDCDDPAAPAFPGARAAVARALADTPALVADGVGAVVQYRGERAAGADASRLVAEFSLYVLVPGQLTADH